MKNCQRFNRTCKCASSFVFKTCLVSMCGETRMKSLNMIKFTGILLLCLKDVYANEWFVYDEYAVTLFTEITYSKEAAESACQNQVQGTLVNILSRGLQNEINTALQKLPFGESNFYLTSGYVHDGGFLSSNSFRWKNGDEIPDGGSTVGFQNWNYKSPRKEVGNCLYVIAKDNDANGFLGEWDELPCSQRSHYICQSTCTDDYCKNGGVCDLSLNRPRCTCHREFTGPTCEKETFLPNPSLTQCTYHIRIKSSNRATYNEASQICENLNSVLAILKRSAQQQALDQLLRRQYQATELKSIHFWLGGECERNNGVTRCYWIDNSYIPKRREHGFNNWGYHQPTVYSNRDKLALSNSPNLLAPNSATNTETSFKWTNRAQSKQYGFVCEKRNPAFTSPCASKPCKNSGTCLAPGCSTTHTCNCADGYTGANCENVIPVVIDVSPMLSSIFNETFTLSCKVRGTPLPRIIWRISKSEQEEGEDITNSSGSPFYITNTQDANTIDSKLTMMAGGLCLEKTYIWCWVASDLLRTHFRGHKFTINEESYKKFRSSYFVFSQNSEETADQAKESCIAKETQLASVPDRETHAFLVAEARNRYNKGTWGLYAWIGLRKENNGIPFWLNQDPFIRRNAMWAGKEPSSWNCAYMYRYSDWKWEATTYCSYYLYDYICELKSNDEIKIESVSTPDCSKENITSMTIRWRAPPASIRISHNILVYYTNGQRIQDKTVIPENTMDSDGVSETTFTNLIPKTSYMIQISFSEKFCSSRRRVLLQETTGYGIPPKVKDPSLSLRYDNQCIAHWKWPEEKIVSVENFGITISSVPVSPGNDFAIPDQFVEMLANATERFITFPALPNRRHIVQIFAQTCGGRGPVAMTAGSCKTPPKAPLVPSPTIDTVGSTMVLSFKDVDQRNGTISCFFVIGIYYDEEVTINKTEASKEFLQKLTRREETSLKPGQPYLAVASPSSLEKDISFVIGDGKNSSCDVTIVPLSRHTRQAVNDNLYTATNIPFETQKFYNFYVIYTTPLPDGTIEYSASEVQAQISPVQAEQENGFDILWVIVAVAGVLLLLFLIFIICIIRKRKSSQKNKMGTSNNLEMHEATPSIENTPTTNEPKVPMLNPYDDVYVPSKTDEVPGKTTAGNNSPYEIPPSEYENVALNKNVYGNTAIPTNRLKEIYTAMMQQDSTTLEDEFSAIKAAANAMEAPKTAATSNESKKLNRYKNILPYDSSRVVLEPNDTKDFPPNGYINASYIDSYNQPKFFIATQGPLDKTIGHFWTMIWQKKCHVIVMLAKLSENGKRKCSKYWPDEKATMNVGSFEIVAKEVTCYGCYVARKLELALKGSKESSLTVTQYQYTVWPDHGVPVTTTGLVRLHSAVLRKADAFPPAPIVVHCSAGAGRTGTLIGIDYLMREMKEKSSVDVYSAVMNMRRQRCDMVQTLNQYRFLHKVITESYELGDTDFFANDLAEKIHGQELNSYQEFHNLNMILPLNTSRDFGSKSAYAEKNRVKEKTLIPYDRSRVTMTKGGFDKTTPYINASFIQEYICCGTLIATQGPMSNTVNEFWRCIVDQNVNMIVMLTQLQEDNKEMCFPYWPEEIDSIQQFGRINVKLTSITEESKYIIRNFDVTWKNITTNVAQFHFSQWAEKEAEPNKDDLISILNDVISFRNQTPQGCMMVHCSDGLGRSGVFCAMINLIERLNAEHRIDVFRTVKDLRDMRPGMVSSLDQYKLCYSSLVQYLSSFDLYSNFNA